MRIVRATALALAIVSPLALGQKVELNLDHLKDKAKAANEVNLDGAALDAALKAGLQAMAKKDAKGQGEQIRQALAGVKGIYVRNYEFDKPGAYTDADVESILKQIRGKPEWSNIISVKEKRERTEVCLMSRGDQAVGLLVLAAEPQELTVVNIVGAIGVAQVKELVNSRILGYMTAAGSAGAESKDH
jgi:hypothetical protein